MICISRRFLQDRVGRDHFARNEILADAEMLERALCLRSPEFVGGNVDLAKAVHLFANVASHGSTFLKLTSSHAVITGRLRLSKLIQSGCAHCSGRCAP